MAGTPMDRDIHIRWAEAGDVDAIARVVNAAFRRAESFFVERDRIDVAALRRMMEKGRFLLAEAGGDLLGCVFLELRGERAYFGLLAVDPGRQRKGLGRRLIREVEDAAREAKCRFMDIQIVNLRAELPPFYRRLEYVETGTGPFPAEVVTKEKCHFIVMSKPLV
ncbi:MAG: GNAT family N-acetyltransferase [Candidatus Acidiferrales bacterium]